MHSVTCLLLALLALAAMPASAGVYRDAGAAAYQFLKLEVSPRASALGGTVLLNSGGFGVLNSPAATASLDGGAFVASHGEYFGSVAQNCIAMISASGRWRFSGAVSSVSASGLELRQEATSEPEGTFSVWNIAMAGGAAVRTGPLDLGVSLKLIREKIHTDGSWGFSVDAGAIARPLPWLEAGIALLNAGPSIEYARYDSYRLPLTWRAGTRVSAALPYAGPASLVAEVFKPIDNDAGGALGAEFLPVRWLALRAGTHIGDDSRSFTAGAGLTAGGWTLDYAWVPGEYSLGDIHRISLSRSL